MPSAHASQVVIAVTGASGAGKTTLAYALKNRLQQAGVEVLHMDDYYQDNSKGKSSEELVELNYDSPNLVQLELLQEHVKCFKAGKSFRPMRYSFETAKSEPAERVIEAKDKKYLILEGMFVLSELLRDTLDAGVYMDVDFETAFARRLERSRGVKVLGGVDFAEFTLGKKQEMYEGFTRYVQPTSQYADVRFNNLAVLDDIEGGLLQSDDFLKIVELVQA